METFWELCEAIGVGAAAGLSPLVAIAMLVLMAAVGLGIKTDDSDVGFLAGIAAVIVAVVVVLQSFMLIAAPGGLKLRVAADRPRFMTVHVTLAVLLGAVAGGIVLNAENGAEVVGAIVGAGAAALVAIASGTLLGGVGARLDASAAREKKKNQGEAQADADASKRIIAFGVDMLTLAAVILPLAIPFTGLILPILAIAVIIGSRRRESKKHEGLRVLN